MSVIDEIADEIWGVMPEVTRWRVEDAAKAVLVYLAERGMVVLGPDGELLDVRPALRALRELSICFADPHAFLDDACLAAAEEEP
jgi:hypothetical protein